MAETRCASQRGQIATDFAERFGDGSLLVGRSSAPSSNSGSTASLHSAPHGSHSFSSSPSEDPALEDVLGGSQSAEEEAVALSRDNQIFLRDHPSTQSDVLGPHRRRSEPLGLPRKPKRTAALFLGQMGDEAGLPHRVRRRVPNIPHYSLLLVEEKNFFLPSQPYEKRVDKRVWALRMLWSLLP